MSTPNSNNTLTNTDSNISSLSSTSRDFGSLPLEDMEAIMKAKREELEQAKVESENTAHLTQLNNMPRTVIENFMRTEQLKQQQAALQATSSASSAASDN